MDTVTCLFVKDVKSKQAFVHVDDEHIVDLFQEYIRLHPKAKDMFTLSEKHIQKNKFYKEAISFVRDRVRKRYGIYHKDAHKKESLLDMNNIEQAMLQHLSTKERLPVYKDLYKELSKRVNLDRVADIGCGFNPLGVVYFEKKPSLYIAIDLFEQDMALLRSWALKQHFSFTCLALDVVKHVEKLKSIEQVDTVFLFKVLDIFEKQQRFITYDILGNIQTKQAVISFSAVNVRQKPLTRVRRGWFEKACDLLNISYTFFEMGTEIYYVCTLE